MENIEENVVTKGAAKADPMPSSGIPVEDLGGPTPENYKPDDDSAKLKDPASTLAQVKDVVNAKAMKAEEAETEEEVIEEEEATTDEVVAEEESETTDEVVAEEETSEEEVVAEEEEKYDVLNSMVDKLDEMESKLNEQIDRNVALNRRLAESNADGVFASVAEGLADTQKEKLATLAENVEFESETDYREKLVTLKESYFPTKTSAPKSTSENLSEEVSTDEVISEETTPRMQAYLDILSRAAKK